MRTDNNAQLAEVRLTTASSSAQITLTEVKTDRDAEFAELFRAHAPMVSQLVLKVLGRPQDVADVVQDVFLSLHRAQESNQIFNSAAVRGWLATTAVRMATTKLRKRRLRQILSLDVGDLYDNLAGPGASSEEKALVKQIYRTLDRVSATERVAWALRYVEGETMEQVAQLCNCSMSTAKRRVNSAHEVLHTVFESGPAAEALGAYERRVQRNLEDS